MGGFPKIQDYDLMDAQIWRPRFLVIFRIEISMQIWSWMTDLDSLNNFCSINFSLKSLVWPVQSHKVWRFLVNLAKTLEIARLCVTVQVKRGLLEKSLLNKSCSGNRDLSFKTKFASIFQIWKWPKISAFKFKHPWGHNLKFWGNPPWDLWGLFPGISTICPGSLCKNSALTPKVRPFGLFRAKFGTLYLQFSGIFKKNPF